MFKCNTLLIPLVFFLTLSCTTGQRPRATMIDVQKVCGENIPLVAKIMAFSPKQFDQKKPLDPRWSWEQIWDLKTSITDQYGLRWLQLRFQHGKLQAVWFGPRKSLQEDLKFLGLKKPLLLNKKGKIVSDFNTGVYYSRDLNNRKIRVEHKGGPQKGTTVTCFRSKRF